MTEPQEKRVNNEDFGGLLKLACNRIPAELASWLVDCFDPETSQLVFPGRGRIAVTAQSVSDVFGLPNCGDQVKYELDVDAINFIHGKYDIERGQAPRNDTIMDRVRDNKEATDDFFRSWLMIAVSTFLCPPTSLSISPRCYPALVDLSRVKHLNWCKFVVDQLNVAVQTSGKKKAIRGCLFLLVILYVDSLQVSGVDIPETKPRVAAWTWKLLDAVIKLDTNPDGSFGKLELKRSADQGNSVIQDSLFQIDDLRRFVSSRAPRQMSDQKKRKFSDAIAIFCAGFTEIMGNLLQQVSEMATTHEDGPSNERVQARAKHPRTRASRTEPSEDAEPIEDSNSEGDSEYVLDSEDDGSEAWESDNSEGSEDIMGNGFEGMVSEEGSADEDAPEGGDVPEGGEKDLEVDKEEIRDVAQTTKSERILQDMNAKDKSGPAATFSTPAGKGVELDIEDNLPLATRLATMKIDASSRKGGCNATVLNPIALEVVPHDRSKADRRAKLKLPQNTAQGNEPELKDKGIESSKPRTRSLDFTPPRCDIMRFIDVDSPPEPSAHENQEINGVLNGQPSYENSPYEFDEDILQKLEEEGIRAYELKRAQSQLGEGINIYPNQNNTAQDPSSAQEQKRNTPPVVEVSGSANNSITPTYQPPPRRQPKKPAALLSPFIDLTKKKTFKCSKIVSDLYNAVCAFGGSLF